MTSKDSHDPGWNDPPIFTYDKATAIQAAAATKKGISLNKRVAFPISSNTQNQQQNVPSTNLDGAKRPPMSQPPLPPSVLSPPSVKLETNTETSNKPQTNTELTSEERLNKVLQNLQIETNSDEEIVKRIKIMEKMWTDGKLEEKVQCRLLELSEALVKGDTDTADHIQKGLMVDYVSQCSTWMSGIRHLINLKKKATVNE